MSIATYTKAGAKATSSVTLPKDVFGLEVNNHELLKQAYISYLANGRTNNAKTKTRGEVSGGGRKPWRQKGTGRARFGSTRNPIWRKGGIAFGPTGEENYRKEMGKVAKRVALRQALSLKAAAKAIIAIEAFESKTGKVADTNSLLSKLAIKGQCLVVTTAIDPMLERATRNLPQVSVMLFSRLNVYDVLNADQLVLTKDAVDQLANWLAPKAAQGAKS